MNRVIAHIVEEAGTDRLGRALARALPDGTIVSLEGTLGAGKTRLTQAIAAGCGIDRGQVVSPTFVLMQRHAGPRPLIHVDAYRLRDDDDFLRLGPEEWFASPALTIIEWGDKVIGCLPPEQLVRIEITVAGPTERTIEVRAGHPRFAAALAQLQAELAGSDMLRDGIKPEPRT